MCNNQAKQIVGLDNAHTSMTDIPQKRIHLSTLNKQCIICHIGLPCSLSIDDECGSGKVSKIGPCVLSMSVGT